MTSSFRHWIATGLAHALLADAHQPGGRTTAALHARARACLGAEPAWLRPLVAAVAPEFGVRWEWHTVPTLAACIAGLPQLDAAFDGEHEPPSVRRLVLRPVRQVRPPFALESLDLPCWDTPADLSAWLELPAHRLQWLTAPAQNYREVEPGRALIPPSPHYHALLQPKNTGGLRLIEVPKPELKQVQKRLLAGLLDRIPPHESAHGFVRGRSVLGHAREHAGQAVVIAYDLREFFNSIGAARIRAVWRTLGYAEGTAAALAALTTARTPRSVRERLLDAGSIGLDGARRLASPHLPQGAPTSPALANLCAFGLDLRLEGLAWRFGARYSRYADDIVFSGPRGLARERRALHAWVQAIARDEGFVLHPGKTREMPRHCRQQVTGIVVNEKPNLERGAYDRLRAQLHRFAASGCDAQTHARLQGQVSWATQLVVASRADKLRRMLAAVAVR